MKEDLNIDKLFKQKFESFEGNVDPSAWANISSSIGAGATGGVTGATAVGLSGFAKVAIIVGAAAITSLGVWYFSGNEDSEPTIDNSEVVSNHNENTSINKENVVAVEENDLVENNDNNIVEENNEESELNNGEVNSQSVNSVTESPNNNTVTEDPNDNTVIEDPDENSVTEDPDENTVVEDPDNNTVKEDPNDENKTFDIEASPEWELVDGNTISFTSNATNHDKVMWKLGDGNVTSGDELTHTYNSPGKKKVHVIVSTIDGKKKEYDIVVDIEVTSEISEVPNIFTPGGDMANDYYSVKTKDIKHFNIVIQDRSGKIVYSSKDPNFEWDGEKMDGTGKVQPGKYYVKVDAYGEDGYPHSKIVTLTIK